MNTNTYVNNYTSNTLRRIDETRAHSGMNCKSQTTLKSKKPFHSSADVFLSGNNITGKFENIMVWSERKYI